MKYKNIKNNKMYFLLCNSVDLDFKYEYIILNFTEKHRSLVKYECAIMCSKFS